MNEIPHNHMYEKHVLLGLNRVYYLIYKCTTCHHYTNIIKSLINLIKVKSLFTIVEGSSLNLSIAQDSAWHLN
jgi:hypothetical protein